MQWLLFVLLLAAGSVQHFLYGLLGQPRLLAWLLPVSESPWEHFKLAVYPLAAGLLWYARRAGLSPLQALTGTVCASVHGFLTMMGIYFFYRAGLGVSKAVLWVDLLNYFVTMLSAWRIGLWVTDRAPLRTEYPAALLLLGAAGFFAFASFHPPKLPLFQ